MINLLPIQRKISAYNFYSGNKVKYIVIHDVGAVSSAKNNVDYFSGGNRNASAHYFVDDNSIWQSVEDHNGAWHVGDGYDPNKGTWLAGITNTNSIGIEMCLKAPLTVTDKTVANTIELTKYLMQKHNVPIERVVRHYDASRKACPGSFKANNWAKWNDFKKRLSGASVTTPSKPTPAAKKVTVAKHATHYSKSSGGKVIAGWVKGSTFEVKQERAIKQSHSNREYLLANNGKAIGWVLSQDIIGGYGSDKVGKTTTSKPSATTSAWKSETGTFTANTTINVRDKDSTSGKIVATYYKGQSVNYDKYRIDTNGYVWISYMSFSGQRRYMATGESKNGKRTSKWGDFK